jgi:hypothetical protein
LKSFTHPNSWAISIMAPTSSYPEVEAGPWQFSFASVKKYTHGEGKTLAVIPEHSNMLLVGHAGERLTPSSAVVEGPKKEVNRCRHIAHRMPSRNRDRYLGGVHWKLRAPNIMYYSTL